jgi:hypothetical protein
MLFPQPTELTIDEPLEAVDAECPKCGDGPVFKYRLVDYRGWLRVTKCRACLNVLDRVRVEAPAQGGAPIERAG